MPQTFPSTLLAEIDGIIVIRSGQGFKGVQDWVQFFGVRANLTCLGRGLVFKGCQRGRGLKGGLDCALKKGEAWDYGRGLVEIEVAVG